MESIRTELLSLGASLAETRDMQEVFAEVPAYLVSLETRLVAAERRAEEQEEVLRRVLSRLIEWSERDERSGPFATRAA